MKQPIVIEFPNKFKLVYENPKSDLPISSIAVYCDIGSIYEDKDKLKGASHMIEHMCFKGTRKNPSSIEINKKFGEWGSDINASTEKRLSCFTIKCQNDFLDENITLLSDMLLNSVFNKKEYEKEFMVIIEECLKDKDDPDIEIDNIINQELFKDSAYSYPVDDISFRKHGSNYKDVFDMYKLYYIQNRMVMSICTLFPIEHLISIIKKSDFYNKKGAK